MDAETYDQIGNMFDELLSPAQIARQLKLATREAVQHLFVLIGEGRIKRSDLFFILGRKFVAADIHISGILDHAPAAPQKPAVSLWRKP